MPATFRSITERLCAELAGGKPDVQPNEIIRDRALAGFGVVVGKTKSSFVVEARAGRGGRNVRHTLGAVGKLELEQARIAAKQALGRLASGVDLVVAHREKLAEQRRANLTIADGLAAALAHDLKPATVKDYTRDTDAIGWNHRKLTSITADQIVAKYKELGAGASASRAMRSLRRSWNCAREIDPSLPAFPSGGLKATRRGWATAPRKQRTILDAVMPGWRTAVAAIKRDDARDLVLFCLYSGCRISEALRLTVADVDLRTGVFVFRDTKADNDCRLPITKQTRPILARRAAAPFDANGHLFPQDVIRRQLAATLAITRWSWHDLRRTFIGAAHRAGVPDVYARRLTNHAVPAADAHAGYITADPDVLREYAQRTCDYLDGLAKANVRRLRAAA